MKKNHSDRFSQFDRDDNIKPIPFRLAKAISNQAISPESYLHTPIITYLHKVCKEAKATAWAQEGEWGLNLS